MFLSLHDADGVVSFRDGAYVDYRFSCSRESTHYSFFWLHFTIAPASFKSSFWLNSERKVPGSSGPREYVTFVHRFELRRGWNKKNIHYSYRDIFEQTALCDSEDDNVSEPSFSHVGKRSTVSLGRGGVWP